MYGKLAITCFKYRLESPQQLSSVFNEPLIGTNREDIWFGNRRKIIRSDCLVLFYLFVIIRFFSQGSGQIQGVQRVRQGNLLCAHDPQRGKKDQGTSLIKFWNIYLIRKIWLARSTFNSYIFFILDAKTAMNRPIH